MGCFSGWECATKEPVGWRMSSLGLSLAMWELNSTSAIASLQVTLHHQCQRRVSMHGSPLKAAELGTCMIHPQPSGNNFSELTGKKKLDQQTWGWSICVIIYYQIARAVRKRKELPRPRETQTLKGGNLSKQKGNERRRGVGGMGWWKQSSRHQESYKLLHGQVD